MHSVLDSLQDCGEYFPLLSYYYVQIFSSTLLAVLDGVSTMVQCSHNGSQYCQLLQISTMLSKLTGAECGSHGDIW